MMTIILVSITISLMFCSAIVSTILCFRKKTAKHYLSMFFLDSVIVLLLLYVGPQGSPICYTLVLVLWSIAILFDLTCFLFLPEKSIPEKSITIAPFGKVDFEKIPENVTKIVIEYYENTPKNT